MAFPVTAAFVRELEILVSALRDRGDPSLTRFLPFYCADTLRHVSNLLDAFECLRQELAGVQSSVRELKNLVLFQPGQVTGLSRPVSFSFPNLSLPTAPSQNLPISSAPAPDNSVVKIPPKRPPRQPRKKTEKPLQTKEKENVPPPQADTFEMQLPDSACKKDAQIVENLKTASPPDSAKSPRLEVRPAAPVSTPKMEGRLSEPLADPAKHKKVFPSFFSKSCTSLFVKEKKKEKERSQRRSRSPEKTLPQKDKKRKRSRSPRGRSRESFENKKSRPDSKHRAPEKDAKKKAAEPAAPVYAPPLPAPDMPEIFDWQTSKAGAEVVATMNIPDLAPLDDFEMDQFLHFH